MKKKDAKKMMAEIAEAIEKRYTCVKVTVKVDEWEKGDYHRLISILSASLK